MSEPFHLNLLFLILVASIWFKEDASIICLTFSTVNPSDIIRFFRSWILVEARWPLWDMVCGHLWFLLLRSFRPLSWQIFVTITWRGNYLSSGFDCPEMFLNSWSHFPPPFHLCCSVFGGQLVLRLPSGVVWSSKEAIQIPVDFFHTFHVIEDLFQHLS